MNSKGLLSVTEARARILAGVSKERPAETVALERAFGGCVRLAARPVASVRPKARSSATVSAGRSFETPARIRARASVTESSPLLFIVHSPVASDWIVAVSAFN
jgi:molybdopterin biosynthesis enzyme